MKNIRNTLKKYWFVWLLGLILTLFILIVFKSQRLWNLGVKIFTNKDREFQWVSLTALSAIIALGLSWSSNVKNIRASTVSASRIKWIKELKEDLTDYILVSHKIRAQHDLFYEKQKDIILNNSELKMHYDQHMKKFNKGIKENEQIKKLIKDKDGHIENLKIKYDVKVTFADKYDFNRVVNNYEDIKLDDLKQGDNTDKYLRYQKLIYLKYNDDLVTLIRNDDKLRRLRNNAKNIIGKLLHDTDEYKDLKSEHNQIMKLLEQETIKKKNILKMNLSDNADNNLYVYKIENIERSFKAINPLLEFLDTNFKRCNDYLYEYAVYDLVDYSRNYLKKEWEKVKDE